MKTRTKRLLAAVFALTVISCSLAGWGVVRVVAWARDLPNRITIDGDVLADSFGSLMVLSYHEVLDKGDPQMQRELLRNFSNFVAEDPEARAWVRSEFSDDLTRLTSSSNSDVSTAAADLLASIAEVQGDGAE